MSVTSDTRAFDLANWILGVLLAVTVGGFLILRWKAPAPLFGMGVPDYFGEKLGAVVVVGCWLTAYLVSCVRKAWSPWLFLFNVFSFLTVLLSLAVELYGLRELMVNFDYKRIAEYEAKWRLRRQERPAAMSRHPSVESQPELILLNPSLNLPKA